MLESHLIFGLILFIFALVVHDNLIFTIIYLLIGVYIAGRLWSARVMRGLVHERHYIRKAFYGEEVQVQLTLSNRSWLPIVWLRLIESVPTEIAPIVPLRHVCYLGPHGQIKFSYLLRARKRGYYPIGPLFASSGDLFGLTRDEKWKSSQDELIVYPRMIRFSNLRLPSSSPQGSIRHTQPGYEDPSQAFGKREYINGDSLRRIDWKATASTGHLQVKIYDNSISLTTEIILGLNIDEYDSRYWIDATELAITIAASIAEWVIRNKQSAGLITNGSDPLGDQETFSLVTPRKGHTQLIQIFELLARIQARKTRSLVELIQHNAQRFPWGTSIVLISGGADDNLFQEVFRCRKHGLGIVLVLVGRISNIRKIKERCKHFKIPLYYIRNEFDLDQWR